MKIVATWPDHAFDSPAEAAAFATRALSDMSKALGVNEPTVSWVGPVHDAAGACEPEYHRGSVNLGWSTCRCGTVAIGATGG